MEDFFSLILEEIMGTVCKPLHSIKRAGLHAFLQIVVCIIISAVFIGIVFLVTFVLGSIKTKYDIVIHHPVVKAIVTVLVFAVCLALLLSVLLFLKILLGIFKRK